MKYEKICKTLDDTKELAEKFAKLITNGCFISLYGEIGAGKTAFVKLVADALEVKENESEVTVERLQDSYFEDLKKSILLFINALVESGYVNDSIITELTDTENTEEILNLIKNLEFKKMSLKDAKGLELVM